jgi:hypothetical protein
VLGLDLLVDGQGFRGLVLLLGDGQPVVEVEVRDGDGLAGDRPLQAVDGQRRPSRLQEEAGQDLGRSAEVLVARGHALQERDRAVAIARGRRRLAALEGEAGLLEERDGARRQPGLLVELGRRLGVVRALVALRGEVLVAGADVDAARRRPALGRLVRPRRVREHPHLLEQFGRALVVLALEEVPGRLRGLPGLERDLPAEVRRLHAVAALLVGVRGQPVVLRAQVQLGRFRVLPWRMQTSAASLK